MAPAWIFFLAEIRIRQRSRDGFPPFKAAVLAIIGEGTDVDDEAKHWWVTQHLR
jgi:hypothetical protein